MSASRIVEEASCLIASASGSIRARRGVAQASTFTLPNNPRLVDGLNARLQEYFESEEDVIGGADDGTIKKSEDEKEAEE